MNTKVKCYKYSPADDPFLMFETGTIDEMIEKLAGFINWRDYPNDIWVKIGCENCLMYDPMLDIFKDWNGVRFTNISKDRLIYYFNR